jgi:hypothetical protein
MEQTCELTKAEQDTMATCSFWLEGVMLVKTTFPLDSWIFFYNAEFSIFMIFNIRLFYLNGPFCF